MKKILYAMLMSLLLLPVFSANIDLLIRRAVDNLAESYLAAGEKLYSRATVTVSEIENISPQAREHYIGQALRVRIIEALGDSFVFRYVDREHLEEALGELKLAVSDITETNDEIRIGNIETVAFIINGKIIDEGENFLLLLELMEVATTTINATVRVIISRDALVDEGDQYAYKYIMANGLGFTLHATPHYTLSFTQDPLVAIGDGSINSASAGVKATYRLTRFLKLGLEYNIYSGDFFFDDRPFQDALNIPEPNKQDAYDLPVWNDDGTLGDPNPVRVAENNLYYRMMNLINTIALPVSYVFTVNRSFDLSIGLGPVLNIITYSQKYDSVPTRVAEGLDFKRYTVDMTFLGVGLLANLDAEYFFLPRFAVNGGLNYMANWMLTNDESDLYAYSPSNGEAYYTPEYVSVEIFGLNPYYMPDGRYIPENFFSANHLKIYLGVSVYF